MLYRLAAYGPGRFAPFFLALAALGVGCTEAQLEAREVTDRFVQGSNRPVDVLFVIDNSNTMEAAQTDFIAAFPTFLSQVDAAEVSWQMGVVTTDMTDPEQRGRLRSLPDGGRVLSATTSDPEAAFAEAAAAGTEGSQMERGLSAAWSAISPPLATHDNLGFSRDGARLHIVVLSDEDDCSDEGALDADGASACAAQAPLLVPVSEFASRFAGLKEASLDVTVHALVETGNSGRYIGCNGPNLGSRYMDLAWTTGGSVYTYCEDLDAVFRDLADQVMGRRHGIPLTRTPEPTSLEVRLIPLGEPDNAEGSLLGQDPNEEDGWTYTESYNTVRFWGPAIPPVGTTVKIRYRVGLGN